MNERRELVSSWLPSMQVNPAHIKFLQCWTKAEVTPLRRLNFGFTSLPANAKRSHLIDNFLMPSLTARFHTSDQGPSDRTDACKPENIALQCLETVGAEIQAIEQTRHSHRNYNSSGFALEQTGPQGPLALCDCEAGPERLLEKSLQQSRKRAQPKRVDDDDVLGPSDGLLTLLNRFIRVLFFPFAACTQKWDFDVGERYSPNGMTRAFGAGTIGIGQCVTEPPIIRIRMSVDECDALSQSTRHSA